MSSQYLILFHMGPESSWRGLLPTLWFQCVFMFVRVYTRARGQLRYGSSGTGLYFCIFFLAAASLFLCPFPFALPTLSLNIPSSSPSSFLLFLLSFLPVSP